MRGKARAQVGGALTLERRAIGHVLVDDGAARAQTLDQPLVGNIGPRQQDTPARLEGQAARDGRAEVFRRHVGDLNPARAQILRCLGPDRRHGGMPQRLPGQPEARQAALDVGDGVDAGEDSPIVALDRAQRVVERRVVGGGLDADGRERHRRRPGRAQ